MSKTDTDRIPEGFPGERITRIPAEVEQRCKDLPIVQKLYITDIGAFPNAPHHYVDRKKGIHSTILIYCSSGSGSVQIDRKQHSVQAGQLIIIPQHTPHSYQATTDSPWSIFWMHFSGEDSESLLKSMGLTARTPSLYIPDTRLIQRSFEDIYACLNYNYSNAGLLAMTSELLRFLSLAKLHQSFASPLRQSTENRIVESIDFMERHLHLSLTVEELAAQAGQSVSYYNRLFRRRTNQSPIAYFIQLKMRKACELLDQTDMSIREIGAELGYDDPYYFSRLFKKVHNSSPEHYRKSVKG